MRLVEVVDNRSKRAARVLADAPGHVSLGLGLRGLLGLRRTGAVVGASASGNGEQCGRYERGQQPRSLHHRASLLVGKSPVVAVPAMRRCESPRSYPTTEP